MKDNKMVYLEDDIQKVQIKSNMYISRYGKYGTFHLVREIIQNAIDELLDDNSLGNKIEITYNKSTDTLVCIDNGRGFPENDYPLDIFVTTLQSGSKFFREEGFGSAGEFGVGLCVTNALSEEFEITSYRANEGKAHTLKFKEGVKTYDKFKDTDKHGTKVLFKVSKKYMGEDSDLPIDDVITWLDTMFYLDSDRLKSKNITCSLRVYDGIDLIGVYKFKAKPFSDLVNKIVPANLKKKDLTDKLYFENSIKFVENSKTLVDNGDGTSRVEKVPTDKEIHFSVALLYITNPNYSEPAIYDTYCNYTNTIENGTHKDVFEEVYCRYMQSKINETISEKQRDKFKVTWDDIRTNMYCVINMSTNAAVGFVGNSKEKISCPDIAPHVKNLCSEGIEKFFNDNKDILSSYIKYIKLTTKARLEAAKVKVATQTERLNTMKEHQMPNYIRCNNTGKQWKELFLTEGNSAGGSARNGSNTDTQAFFLFRGVPFNALKGNLADAMNNKEWHDLVTILKCGIGEKFDLNKLYFNRINILTDSDVDGYNISASILAFFYKYLRPIIETGKLYKVYSPLYKLEGGQYAITKRNKTKIYQDNVVKTYKIKPESSDKFLSKDELYTLLMDVYDYREILINAAEQSGEVNKYAIEIIVAYLTLSGVTDNIEKLDDYFNEQKYITKMMNFIQNKYKESTFNNSRFSIIIDGKRSIIKVNNRFFRKVSELIPIYKKYGYYVEVKDKKSGNSSIMSIGEFLDVSMKLQPTIQSRIKGLGELNGDDLRKTTLDINHRISEQYTVDDVERELAIFELTHGKSKQAALDRKKMMREYKINREDLDN